MLLYIIRHGDPIYNPDTLTDKGRAQAKALAKRLAVHGLDRIYCSPNGRARETAQPTCEALGLEAQIEPWTSEDLTWRDFSADNGRGGRGWTFHCQNTELKTEDMMSRAMSDWYNGAPFSKIDAKKGYERIIRESDAFTEKLGYRREGSVYRIIRPNDERVAVFCHQGFGTTWLSYLLAVPPAIFWSSFDISHSSITILRFQNNKNGLTAPMCITLGDTSHIYESGLPLQYNNTVDI